MQSFALMSVRIMALWFGALGVIAGISDIIVFATDINEGQEFAFTHRLISAFSFMFTATLLWALAPYFAAKMVGGLSTTHSSSSIEQMLNTKAFAKTGVWLIGLFVIANQMDGLAMLIADVVAGEIGSFPLRAVIVLAFGLFLITRASWFAKTIATDN